MFIISALYLLTANFGFAKCRKVNTKSGVGGCMWVQRSNDSADLCSIIIQQLVSGHTHIEYIAMGFFIFDCLPLELIMVKSDMCRKLEFPRLKIDINC